MTDRPVVQLPRRKRDDSSEFVALLEGYEIWRAHLNGMLEILSVIDSNAPDRPTIVHDYRAAEAQLREAAQRLYEVAERDLKEVQQDLQFVASISDGPRRAAIVAVMNQQKSRIESPLERRLFRQFHN